MRTHSQTMQHGESTGRCAACHSVGWLAAAAMAVILTGCGVGASSSAPEAATAPADPAAAGAAVPVAAPPAGAQPIMVTPVGGGGVVVGDPFDAGDGKGAAGVPVAAPPDAGPGAANRAVAAAAPPGAPPFAAPPFGIGQDEDGVGAPPGRVGVEPGDESLPAAAAIPPGRVGAVADDKGAFANQGTRRRKDKDDDEYEGTAADQPQVAVPPAGAGFPLPGGGAAGALPPGLRGLRGGDEGDEAFAPAAGETGQPATIEIKRGSAEEVTTTFLALVAADDMEQAATLIAGRATGLLAKIRDGKATPEELEELKQAAVERGQMTSRPKGGNHMQFSVRGEKTVLLIESDQKEDADCSVVKLEMREAPRRRR